MYISQWTKFFYVFCTHFLLIVIWFKVNSNFSTKYENCECFIKTSSCFSTWIAVHKKVLIKSISNSITLFFIREAKKIIAKNYAYCKPFFHSLILQCRKLWIRMMNGWMICMSSTVHCLSVFNVKRSYADFNSDSLQKAKIKIMSVKFVTKIMMVRIPQHSFRFSLSQTNQ